jgi:Glycerol-3-phosphate responsive antiterminator
VGKVAEVRVGAFLGGLQRNPLIPAVRGPDSALRAALAGAHAAVFVLGGDIFRVLERVKAAGRRPPVCINVDLVGGVSADASGLRFLSGRIEGAISTHRHVIELARETDFLTVHCLFAMASGAVERGGEADPERTTSLRRSLPRPRLPEGGPSLPRAPQKTRPGRRTPQKPRRHLLHTRGGRHRSLDEPPEAVARSLTRVFGDFFGHCRLLVYKVI